MAEKLGIPAGARVQLTGDHALAGQFGTVMAHGNDGKGVVGYWVNLENASNSTFAAPAQVVRQEAGPVSGHRWSEKDRGRIVRVKDPRVFEPRPWVTARVIDVEKDAVQVQLLETGGMWLVPMENIRPQTTVERNTVQAVPTGASVSRAVTLRHANGSTLYGTRYTVQYSPTGAPFIVAPGIYAPEADLMKAGWSVTTRSEVVESYGEGVAVPGPYFTGEGPNQTFEWTGAPKPEPRQDRSIQYPRWLVERVAEAIAAGRAGDWQLPEMQNRNAAEVVLEKLNVVPGDEHWEAEIREDES